jgi:hypothetical protein
VPTVAAVTKRQAFIVRVEPDGSQVTVEDVRAARAAPVESLSGVGTQIERWLALDGVEETSWPDEQHSSRSSS